jgi:hypothetical protein
MDSQPFAHRCCYVNFAEHLQNRWNINTLYPGAPNQWTDEDWRRFFVMLKAFGFTCFEYWIPPTMFDRPALQGDPVTTGFTAQMREVHALAHEVGLQVKAILAVNTVGAAWYFACPHVAEDKALILALWRHWMQALPDLDIVGIFPGDPGGCNRNGCTHETFVELALELCEIIQAENPAARIELGTWGTPFTGWGSDMRATPGWQGEWHKLIDPTNTTPETPCHIWNGDPPRARAAMAYLLKRLPTFPADMLVAINLGFECDGHATYGGDARSYIREIAQTHAVTSWDYSLAEGELICYPHWRLPRMAARRREERAVAPYLGGMTYTMSPKLNVLSLYAAGQFFLDPAADPDLVSRAFCAQLFGEEHAVLGELFEAFEVVPGWGHYPRRRWSKPVLREVYAEIIARLEAADMAGCALPLYPDPESYRQDLLWFARQFHAMAGPEPDREGIRRAYWGRALDIYDTIPMSVDERAEEAAAQFSRILAE